MQTDPNWSNFLWNEQTQQVSWSVFLDGDVPFYLKETHTEKKQQEAIWTLFGQWGNIYQAGMSWDETRLVDMYWLAHASFDCNRRLTNQIELIDFGATREYSQKFIDGYLKLLKAGIDGNRAECIDASIELGYLTGNECEVSAHPR